MKVSLRWLNDFVDVTEFFEKPEALAEALTRGGLEVEEIKNYAKVYQHVVVGMILQKDKHTGSDKLSVCQVTTGEGVVHQIVCGAKNHNANDRVVVALPGADLPGGLKIGRAQVRGVDSAGMLCSADELGLADERAEGIMILPKDAPLGAPFAKYMGLDDVTMELKVTPNRADCLSHYGLAREISCILEKPIKEKVPAPKEGDFATIAKIAVDVQSGEGCPRYCGRFIAGVKVGPSPLWLKKRLENVGLRAINNVVDVTNYVMMEYGQPLHAFDAKELKGGKIVVTPAKSGEKFEALDGKKIDLRGGELLIRDGERVVALAGVVGGLNSGTTDATTDVFLESAYFEPSQVRRTARGHGLQTDSSYRFSRGVNPQGTRLALDRAAELIQEVAGGEVSKDPIDLYPKPITRPWITMATQTVTDRLGYAADDKTFENYLHRLGCEVKKATGGFEILPPTFRMDLETDMDFVEEYGRLNGYEKIPETLPALHQQPANHDPYYVFELLLAQKARATGFSQAMNSAFVAGAPEAAFLGDRAPLAACGLAMPPESVGLVNPLSEEQNRLRATLVYSLWKTAERNFHQGVHCGRLFETGKIALKTEKGFPEQARLAFVAWGSPANLWEKREYPPIFEVKKALEETLGHFGAIEIESWPASEIAPSFLHRGQTGRILCDGKVIGFLGTVHPMLVEDAKIRVPVVLAEVKLDGLEALTAQVKRYQPFQRTPMIDRDLSLVLAEEHAVASVEKAMRALGDSSLKSVQVFDVYAGENLGPSSSGGRTKAVGFRLSFQGANATLRDEEVNASLERILATLKEKFEARLR